MLEEAQYQLGIEPYRIPIVAMASVGIYLSFMVLVKLFGSRVLTAMTASDAVIVIMFGAVAGRVIVGNPPTLAAGIVGLATLMLLEAAFGSIRHNLRWARLIDRRPVLIMLDGVTLEKYMKLAHVSDDDVNSAMRKAGVSRRCDVQAMILEPTGQISIIRAGQPMEAGLLANVLGAESLGQ